MAEDVCGAHEAVQLGKYAATDLRCIKLAGHSGEHTVSRWFGIVRMVATWDNPERDETPAQPR